MTAKAATAVPGDQARVTGQSPPSEGAMNGANYVESIKQRPRLTLDDKEILTDWLKPLPRPLDIVMNDENDNAVRRAKLFSGAPK